ncbi:MAG: LysR family transcriptional regulator [Azospirillaceae bacterium]|nr:LysR family transcriptional regulator [Azospirillaceae bacterium]
MQLRQIRHFLAAVEHGSITQASVEQNVTQPTLTRSIQKLEESLKVTLLDRGRAGVALTRYGEAFAEHARIILNGTAHATADLSAMREGRLGHVRLGLGPSAVQEPIAAALSEVCSERNDLFMSLDYGELAVLLGKLRRGEIDALMDIWREGLDEAGLVVTEIAAVPMVLVARASHPLASRRGLTRGDLAAAAWAVYDTPGADAFYCKMLGVERSINPIRIRCALPGMLRLIALKGDYLTLVARSDVAQDLQRGDLVEIDSEIEPLSSRLCIITRSRAYVTTALRFTVNRLSGAMRV